MKKYIGIILYNVFAKHLPVSYVWIQIGQKAARAFCARLILTKCGRNVNIERSASFSSRVELGDNSGIGVWADIGGKCVIGDNVMMGPDCKVYTRNHRHDRTDIPMCLQGHEEERPVYIGNDVWMGGRVMILPGVRIGDGCIYYRRGQCCYKGCAGLYGLRRQSRPRSEKQKINQTGEEAWILLFQFLALRIIMKNI